MVCKCGSKEFYKNKVGEHVGLYCSECGRWQKWLGKEEQKSYSYKSEDNMVGPGFINIEVPGEEKDANYPVSKIIEALNYEIRMSGSNQDRVSAFERAKNIVVMVIGKSSSDKQS